MDRVYCMIKLKCSHHTMNVIPHDKRNPSHIVLHLAIKASHCAITTTSSDDITLQILLRDVTPIITYLSYYCIAKNFQGRKLLQICGYLRKFSPRNLGTWRPLADPVSNLWKFSLRKLFSTSLWKFSPTKVSRYSVLACDRQFWNKQPTIIPALSFVLTFCLTSLYIKGCIWVGAVLEWD